MASRALLHPFPARTTSPAHKPRDAREHARAAAPAPGHDVERALPSHGGARSAGLRQNQPAQPASRAPARSPSHSPQRATHSQPSPLHTQARACPCFPALPASHTPEARLPQPSCTAFGLAQHAPAHSVCAAHSPSHAPRPQACTPQQAPARHARDQPLPISAAALLIPFSGSMEDLLQPRFGATRPPSPRRTLPPTTLCMPPRRTPQPALARLARDHARPAASYPPRPDIPDFLAHGGPPPAALRRHSPAQPASRTFPHSPLRAPVHGPMAARIIEPPPVSNLRTRGAAHATFPCHDGARTGAVRTFGLDVPRMCLASLWRSTERKGRKCQVQ